MKAETLTLGCLTLVATGTPAGIFDVAILAGAIPVGQFTSMPTEWQSLVAIGDTQRGLQREVKRLRELNDAGLSNDEYRAAAILVDAANKTIERLSAERDLANVRLEVLQSAVAASRSFFAGEMQSDNGTRRELATMVVHALDRITEADRGN